MAASWNNLDVGLDGGALHAADRADSRVRVQAGPVARRAVLFGFPGFSGAMAHNLGLDSRPITWDLLLRCEDLATLREIDAAIRQAAAFSGEGTMTDAAGHTWYRVILVRHAAGSGYQTIRGGQHDGWVRREDKLDFVDLVG